MATSLVKSICYSHESLLTPRQQDLSMSNEGRSLVSLFQKVQEIINFSVGLSRKEGFSAIISERAHSKNVVWEDPKNTVTDLFANALFVFSPGLFCFTLKYSELVEILFLACSSYIFFVTFVVIIIVNQKRQREKY